MSTNMLHSMSPTTPGLQSLPHPFASPNSNHARGFKRSASSDDDDNADGDARPSSSRRNTAVKRACNECRQQKVSRPAPALDASVSRLQQPAAHGHSRAHAQCRCQSMRIHRYGG